MSSDRCARLNHHLSFPFDFSIILVLLELFVAACLGYPCTLNAWALARSLERGLSPEILTQAASNLASLLDHRLAVVEWAIKKEAGGVPKIGSFT